MQLNTGMGTDIVIFRTQWIVQHVPLCKKAFVPLPLACYASIELRRCLVPVQLIYQSPVPVISAVLVPVLDLLQ